VDRPPRRLGHRADLRGRGHAAGAAVSVSAAPHVERFEKIGAAYPCIGYSNERIHVFAAYGLTRGEQALADGEFVEVVEMPLDEAVARARSGDIKDMKTVTALVYAAAHVNESPAAS